MLSLVVLLLAQEATGSLREAGDVAGELTVGKRRRNGATRALDRPLAPDSTVPGDEAVESTATPSAPPADRAVFRSPEATPESSGVAADIARDIRVGNAMPAPAPVRIIPGRRSAAQSACTKALLNSASPVVTSTQATQEGCLGAKAQARGRGEPDRRAPIAKLSGRKARPVWIAVKRSTRCRYRAPVKNVPLKPADTRS